MRKVQYALVVFLAVLITGCSGVRGSGKIVTESRNVSGFTSIEFAGDGQLLIEQTGTESLTVTADDNILPYLITEVKNGRLILREKEYTNLNPTGNVIFKLTTKNLNGIDFAGDGSVDAKGIQSDEFRVNISGDGKVTVNGVAERQDIHLSGDGQYTADNLTSKSGDVHLSGDGRVVLVATDKLNVDLSGDGSVEYIGNPAVTQHVSGDGSIQKR
jgi:predicted small secreted protein